LAQGSTPGCSRSLPAPSLARDRARGPPGPMLATQLVALVAASAGPYSYDQMCVSFRCVNPIFPAMRVMGEDFLAAQDERDWACVKDARADLYLGFCRGMVRYEFAVPVQNGTNKEVGPLIRAEEDKALKQYFQHLSGLKLDAFDYRDPRADPCSESIWRMVCQAHFPKCNVLAESKYLRPCASSCHDYVEKCGVECCDESVQCSWTKEITKADGSSAVESGFVAHAPPSTFCTGDVVGAAARSSLLLALAALALEGRSSSGVGPILALLVAGASLQGCESAIKVDPRAIDGAMGLHSVAAWRQQPDFSLADAFVKQDGTLVYDSCSDHMIDTLHVCSGNGKCEVWDVDDVATPLAFCRCDKAYAGPECRDRRRSQRTAFLWAVFGGLVGADYFYLGFPWEGSFKLLTLGGGGVWYIFDVFRIGVGPPYTRDHYRCAPDLPFWAFIVSSVSLSTGLGFFIFFVFIFKPHIRAKRARNSRYISADLLEEHKARPNAHLSKVKHLIHSGQAPEYMA